MLEIHFEELERKPLIHYSNSIVQCGAMVPELTNISFISVHSSILLEHYSETGAPHEQDPTLNFERLFLLFPFHD